MNNESQNTEYKESWRDEYLKWICGFANAKGGVLYIGVNDSGEVIGLKNAHKLSEDIPNKIVNYLGIVCETNLLKKDDLDYIEIIVEPSNVPINFQGKYHYRSGSTKQELKGSALQQFLLKKMGKQWDEVTNTSATIDCIDEKAIRYFVRKGTESKRLAAESLGNTPQEVLENLRLIDDNGHVKNAAILLFAKCPQDYFPGIQFKIGRFGKDETDLMFQDEIEGNILQMADHVLEVLKSKYLVSPIHYNGMQRIEPLEIPEEAFREMLYNAIIHREYPGAPIQMRVFSDHIELWNIGELPQGYSIDILMHKHTSRPRNLNIAQVFYKAGFVESWGRGIKKICDGFVSAGFDAPVFEENSGGILVTIKRKKITDVVSDVVSLSQVQLTERQQKIINLIEVNPRISAALMSQVLSVVVRTIQRELATMQKLGYIRHEGNTSAGHWIVLKKQEH